MKRLFAVAAVLALVAPVGQVFAAETIVGKIAATDPAQCSFTLRGEGAFYQSNQEPGFCADLKIGEVVAVTFDRSGGTNNVLSVAPFEQQHEVGIVAAVTDDSLILTSGAEFALNDLGPSRACRRSVDNQRQLTPRTDRPPRIVVRGGRSAPSATPKPAQNDGDILGRSRPGAFPFLSGDQPPS
jgi:hypothetical protein